MEGLASMEAESASEADAPKTKSQIHLFASLSESFLTKSLYI